jgi:hypothetical protein
MYRRWGCWRGTSASPGQCWGPTQKIIHEMRNKMANVNFLNSRIRGLQGDVVNLGWPISLLVLWAQMRGKRGVAGSQPMRTAVHITWHGAQINFGDPTPYLTYEQNASYTYSKFYVSGIEGDIMLLKKNNCSEQTDVGFSSHDSKIGQIISSFFIHSWHKKYEILVLCSYHLPVRYPRPFPHFHRVTGPG